MRKIFPSLTALLLVLTLVFTVGTAFAGSKPTIQSEPEDQTVTVGKSLTLTVKEKGATGITWRFTNPETDEIILASKASKSFKGLKVSGQNSDSLVLKKIPLSLDGWQVYCTLKNKSGTVETRRITVHVTDPDAAPVVTSNPPATDTELNSAESGHATDTQLSAAETPTPAPTDTPRPTETPAPTVIPEKDTADADTAKVPEEGDGVTVSAEGAVLQQLDEFGNATGDETDLINGDDSVSFLAVATVENVEGWYLNGYRLEGSEFITAIEFSDVTENMMLEVDAKETETEAGDTEVIWQEQEEEPVSAVTPTPVPVLNGELIISCEGCTFVNKTAGAEATVYGSASKGDALTFRADEAQNGDMYYWSYNDKMTTGRAYAVNVSDSITMVCKPVYKLSYEGCSGPVFAVRDSEITVTPDTVPCTVSVTYPDGSVHTESAEGPFTYTVSEKVNIHCH